MAVNLAILYRGPLSSCNYACGYCPFAKRRETAAELAEDRAGLSRFVDWVAARVDDRISVFFTPWGEALVRKWYRDALERLSHLPNVERAAIQTNLSSTLEWVKHCDPSRLAIWATYHPGEVERRTFLERCRYLSELGVRYSVGIVGLKEHWTEIEILRNELPADVYLWVNAYKRELSYYSDDEVEFLSRIDPIFRTNNTRHPSLGRACRTGHSVISVNGAGTIRRCHFVPEVLGNIYEAEFERMLIDRPCPAETCSCHIGYVHLDHLRLGEVFANGLLERIPAEPIWRRLDESR